MIISAGERPDRLHGRSRRLGAASVVEPIASHGFASINASSCSRSPPASRRDRRAHPALDRRLHAEGPVDADRVHRRRLDRLLVQRPPPRRAAAADALEPARRACASDFSIRARGARPRAAATIRSAPSCSKSTSSRRRSTISGSAPSRPARCCRTVMVEIDVAVFTFDGAADAAARQPRRRAAAGAAGGTAPRTHRGRSRTGRTASTGRRRASRTSAFPGGAGRYEVRRTTFRQDGRPHQLLVLADVSRPLRDEERQAWQRLIRVIGHEINNSLAPIKSIAGSLESMLARDVRPHDLERRHEARTGA